MLLIWRKGKHESTKKYVCMYVCMYVCKYVCMYLSIYVSMYLCIYVSIYIYIYIYFTSIDILYRKAYSLEEFETTHYSNMSHEVVTARGDGQAPSSARPELGIRFRVV